MVTSENEEKGLNNIHLMDSIYDRNNREGLRGWLNPLKYGWERVSYWLQRLTGLLYRTCF